jgi:hypothetical protein
MVRIFLFGFLTTVIKKLSLPYYLRMKVIKLPNTKVWFLLESKSPLEKKNENNKPLTVSK